MDARFERIGLRSGDTVLVDVRDLSGKKRIAFPDGTQVEVSIASLSWRCTGGKWRYAISNLSAGGRRRAVFMHRLIACPPPGFVVDHANGNGLDNRRSNLRVCTTAENIRNMAVRPGSSRFKGVSRSRNRWCAHIGYMSRDFHIGSFATEEAAALAYNAKALELFGEFARLNEVPV